MQKFNVILTRESKNLTFMTQVDAETPHEAIAEAVDQYVGGDEPLKVSVGEVAEDGTMAKPDVTLVRVKAKTVFARPARKTGPRKKKTTEYNEQHERETYDADFYESHRQYSQKGAPFFAQFVRDNFSPLNSICDLGCGTGIFIRDFVGELSKVTGVDFSVGSVKSLDIPVANFVNADLTKPLPFKDHYDVVVSVEVWEHLHQEFEAQYLDNVMSLTPNFIIISCAVPGQWGRHHYSPHDHAYVRQAIESRGYVFSQDLTDKFRGDKTNGIKGVKYLASFYKRNSQIFIKKKD